MFVPIHDRNPLTSIPFQFVTVALIAINVVVFIYTTTSLPLAIGASFAVVPTELIGEGLFGASSAADQYDVVPLAERWTLISYMFMHGDILHIFGNMLFLWVFGDNVEDAMGHVKFLIFYLLCGVFAALAHSWMQPLSNVPLIGASGAVAGVVAAYLMLHPKVNVWVLVARFFPLQIKAQWVLGLWAAMQVVLAFVQSDAPVAWWAHVGGLVAGAVLVLFFRSPGVKLFDQSTPT